MRILFISSIDFPHPLDRGARYHVHHWLKAMSPDHDVDFLLVESYSQRRESVPQLSTAKVINLGEPPKTALPHRLMRVAWSAFAGIPRLALLAMPPAAVEFVRRALKDRRYDLAILWDNSAGGYAPMFQGAIPTIMSRLSVAAVDARDQRKRTGMWHPRWALEEWETRRFEAKTCRAATAICTVNQQDGQELVRRYQLNNIVRSIPIGVEPREFAIREREPNSKIIGFVGNLLWGANVDAVNWLVQEIAPKVLAAHPQVRFRVVGPGSEALREKYSGPLVEFTGHVPSVRDAMADVAVGVVPIFSGTGMRLKLLELLCMGIPSVTTSLGAAGLPCVHGEHVMVADGAAAFAEAVNALLSNAALRAKLKQKGPELAKQYAWEGIEQKVRELVRETMIVGETARPTLTRTL
jgi:glycosyltransferase involved in cell wall biosynthesis